MEWVHVGASETRTRKSTGGKQGSNTNDRKGGKNTESTEREPKGGPKIKKRQKWKGTEKGEAEKFVLTSASQRRNRGGSPKTVKKWDC